MADDPIRERILDDLVDSLRLITGTGDYASSLLGARRGQPRPGLINYAFVAVANLTSDAPARETAEEIVLPLLNRTMPVVVEVRVQVDEEADDLDRVAGLMLADIERAVLADPTRGQIANATVMTGHLVLADESPGTLAKVRVAFEVKYQTVRGNPSAVS